MYQLRRKSSATARCAAVERHRLAGDGDAVVQRHAGVAVLAEHPRVDRVGGDAELVADRGAQPQAVVERVAEHAPPVEPGLALQPACTAGRPGW